MVITVFWAPSWAIPIISVSILFVAVVLLLCCLCIQRKRTDKLKFGISSSRRNFLDISNHSLSKLMIFRNLDSSKNMESEVSKHGSDDDLLETEQVSKRFNNSRLKIDDLDELDRDDVKSCSSGDSRFTFYSTYPAFTRSESIVSETDTFKSTRNSMKSIPVGSHVSSDIFIA